MPKNIKYIEYIYIMIHFGDAIQNQTNLFTIGDPIELVLSFKKEEDQDLDINIKKSLKEPQKIKRI